MARRRGTSRQAVSTARGSNGGDALRLGPSAASPISAAARSAVTEAIAMGTCQCDAAEGIEEVRQRRPERQCAHQDADHQSHVALRPGRCELHADGIDARERHAGDEAQHQRGRRGGRDEQQAGVGDRSRERAHRKEPARIDAIGQAREGAGDAAHDEAGLDAARERRLREAGQAVVAHERRDDGGRGEPQGQRGDLAERDHRDGRPLGHRRRPG